MSDQLELTRAQKDLQLHHTTILRWIQSIQKEVQLPVCVEAVEELVKKRFAPFVESKQLDALDVKEVVADLEYALAEQSKIITKNGNVE